jgi:glycosyltransferase involved in cell wall biosynthesis
MNILFLNSLGKAKWGGGEKWMVNAGKGLASRGHKVTIACIPGSVIEKKSRDAGLKTWSFFISVDIAFWKIPSLKLFLLNNKIDVLICCQNKDVKIGARAARQVGIKAIFARQGIQNLTNRKKYIKPFTQYIDGIITNTNSIKVIYESFGWFPDNFIHVVYNGVETDTDVQEMNLREKYQLPDNSSIIFSAGRLDRQKGFDLLIEVAKMAKDKNLNWQFIIAGEGKLKDTLNGQALRLGVSDMVHFTGFTHHVTAMLKASDVFVMPSRYEGMPNALLEAMAFGKANVATSVNGAPELVEDGVTGFLVETENTAQIFDKLSGILTNTALRKSMEQKSKKRVIEHFTFDKMTDNLLNLINNQLRKN